MKTMSFSVRSSLTHPNPEERYRMLWSIEQSHSPDLVQLRRDHFARWDDCYAPPDENQDPQSNAIFFPGTSGNHEKKSAWSGVIHNERHDNDMRPGFDTSWPRDDDIPDDVGSVVSKILFDSCPETVSVELLVERRRIEHFLRPVVVTEPEERKGFTFSSSMSGEKKAAFERKMKNRHDRSMRVSGLDSAEKLLTSPYLRHDVPSDIVGAASDGKNTLFRLQNLKKWLAGEAHAATNVHSESVLTKLPPRRYDDLARLHEHKKFPGFDDNEKVDLVLLGRRRGIPKGKKTEEVFTEMIASLGLNPDAVCVRPTTSRNEYVHGMAYMTRECIGEHLHFPDKRTGSQVVSFTWTGNNELTQEMINRRRRFETPFVVDATSKKDASNGRHFLFMWPRDPTPEGTHADDVAEISSSNTLLLWLPGCYDGIEEDVFNRCLNGEGEDPRIRSRLQSGTTDAGNIFWNLVLEEIPTKIKPEKCWSKKMCHLLALTRTILDADHLLVDHEYPMKDIKKFVKDLSSFWHRVLAKDNRTLGLGLTDNQEMPENCPSSSREALKAMLRFHALKFEKKMKQCYGIESHSEWNFFEG